MTIFIVRRLIREIPMAITSTARTHCGICFVNGPTANAPSITMSPLIILATGVRPPLATDSEERVSDPEAGIPERSAQAILLVPIENIAWFALNREPVRAARDFPIEIPSSTHISAIARAGPVSSAILSTDIVGILHDQSRASIPLKCATR